MIVMSLMWLVGMASLLLVAVLCILVLVRALVAPPGMDKMASCGACGHNLHSVEPGRCPECGADLTKSGVATPAMLVRLRGSTFEAIIAWTILIAGLGSVVGGVILSMMAMGSAFGGAAGNGPVNITMTLSPQPNFSAGGNSAANYTIDMVIDVDVDSKGAANSGTIEAVLWHAGDEHILKLDAKDDSWALLDISGDEVQASQTFDDTSIVALYAAAGLDITDADIQTQMDDLGATFGRARRRPNLVGSTFSTGSPTGGGLSQSGMSYNSFGMSPGFGGYEVGAAIIALVTFAIYVVGIVLIVIRRGRLMRAAVAGAG